MNMIGGFQLSYSLYINIWILLFAVGNTSIYKFNVVPFAVSLPSAYATSKLVFGQHILSQSYSPWILIVADTRGWSLVKVLNISTHFIDENERAKEKRFKERLME